ncbi:MAG: helix-turn-helix domain-containing protein [Paludibacteraceae bacterium]|nr:helix-turn-helix domain-containing protein [Paludibacteraceae bacterium]
MAEIVPNIDAFNAYFHQGTEHPHIAVGDLSRADLSLFEPLDFDMYCIVLMDTDFGELVKAKQAIRYQPGTLFTLRPGEVVSMNLDYSVRPRGWMLAFREEVLIKTGLGRDFYMFDYFNHNVNEALELTKMERGIILNCFANINSELYTKPDYLSNHLLRLGIGQLLSYYKRFFERQYAEKVRGDHLFQHKLEMMIDNYLSSGSASQHGQPTVGWCAEQFNLSSNYFGDLVKKEMHISAQEYIHSKVVDAAKHLLDTTEMPVNEIAQELGFCYPNHFNRMFRKRTGLTPLQYRRNNI